MLVGRRLFRRRCSARSTAPARSGRASRAARRAATRARHARPCAAAPPAPPRTRHSGRPATPVVPAAARDARRPRRPARRRARDCPSCPRRRRARDARRPRDARRACDTGRSRDARRARAAGRSCARRSFLQPRSCPPSRVAGPGGVPAQRQRRSGQRTRTKSAARHGDPSGVDCGHGMSRRRRFPKAHVGPHFAAKERAYWCAPGPELRYSARYGSAGVGPTPDGK